MLLGSGLLTRPIGVIWLAAHLYSLARLSTSPLVCANASTNGRNASGLVFLSFLSSFVNLLFLACIEFSACLNSLSSVSNASSILPGGTWSNQFLLRNCQPDIYLLSAYSSIKKNSLSSILSIARSSSMTGARSLTASAILAASLPIESIALADALPISLPKNLSTRSRIANAAALA